MGICDMNYDSRKSCLSNLLNIEKDVRQLKEELSHFPWDAPEELIVLERGHLEKAINKYLIGQLEENDLVDWANLIELREDIGYEAEYEDLLKDLIFRLANPEINDGLNKTQLRSDLQLLRE